MQTKALNVLQQTVVNEAWVKRSHEAKELQCRQMVENDRTWAAIKDLLPEMKWLSDDAGSLDSNVASDWFQTTRQQFQKSRFSAAVATPHPGQSCPKFVRPPGKDMSLRVAE
jgi:hypothetical protein